jgi:hypothetical protein
LSWNSRLALNDPDYGSAPITRTHPAGDVRAKGSCASDGSIRLLRREVLQPLRSEVVGTCAGPEPRSLRLVKGNASKVLSLPRIRQAQSIHGFFPFRPRTPAGPVRPRSRNRPPPCVREVVARIGSNLWGRGHQEAARYGQGYKDRIVARLLPPESSSVEQVSREVGVSAATLERWRADALANGSGVATKG